MDYVKLVTDVEKLIVDIQPVIVDLEGIVADIEAPAPVGATAIDWAAVLAFLEKILPVIIPLLQPKGIS
jgi:predicted protein tyrosine phosphatase